MTQEYYHFNFLKRKVSECKFIPKKFKEHLKECWLKEFTSSTTSTPYCNFEQMTVFWNFGSEDLISKYNYVQFNLEDDDGIDKIINSYPTSFSNLQGGCRLNFQYYLGNKIAILLKVWSYKGVKRSRILGIICKSTNAYNVFRNFFTDDLYNARVNKKTNYDDWGMDDMSDEDIIRDGFDDDMDAWNHYNQ